MAVGVVAGSLAAGTRPRLRDAVALVGLGALGLVDDVRSAHGGLSAGGRLGGQLAAGVTMASGIGGPGLRAAAVAAVPGVVNVTNFMDGINGISGLTATVWGLNAVTSEDDRVAATGALVAGAGLGFLPWNVPRARIFLGDTGSYLLGGLMASGIIGSLRSPRPWHSAVQIGAPLLPYAADATQAIIRRRRAGHSLSEAHREHVYQRLVDDARLTHIQVAGLHALLAAVNALAWRGRHSGRSALASAALCGAWLAAPRAARSRGSA